MKSQLTEILHEHDDLWPDLWKGNIVISSYLGYKQRNKLPTKSVISSTLCFRTAKKLVGIQILIQKNFTNLKITRGRPSGT